MSFLRHITACNRWNRAEFQPWMLAGETLGWVRAGFAEALCAASAGLDPGAFELSDGLLHWRAEGLDAGAREALLESICARLRAHGRLPAPQGERYPVTPGGRNQAVCTLDRAHAPYFGTRAFGQHLNGYVRTREGIELWVARRAPDRRHYPNRLDNLVAGGLPMGLSLAENLRKECQEEAGLDAEVAARALPVGAISYCHGTESGLKPDLMYCYDLELPPEWTPVCRDGEVACFMRWPVARVMETVRDSDAFKLNCNLVILDFLIRHGVIEPEHPEYAELVCTLRSPLPAGPSRTASQTAH